MVGAARPSASPTGLGPRRPTPKSDRSRAARSLAWSEAPLETVRQPSWCPAGPASA